MLTSETLEHVPDLDAALGEIRRVLVPGGRHIFTVPLLPRTRANVRPRRSSGPTGRSRTAPRGSAIPAATGAIRSSPSSGPICPTLLRRAGFEVDVLFGPTREDDLAQVYVCRKPVVIAASLIAPRRPSEFRS